MIWYLGHPVAEDEKHCYEDNLNHALKVARLAWDAGFRVIMPWYAHCVFLDDKNPQHRADGLECDKLVIHQLRRVIFCGHRLSSGMQIELRKAYQCNSQIINLVGVRDVDLPEALADAAKHYL